MDNPQSLFSVGRGTGELLIGEMARATSSRNGSHRRSRRYLIDSALRRTDVATPSAQWS